MYKQQYPQSRVSYHINRRIFNNSYIISFGYPRKDTCDVHAVKLKQLNADIMSCQDNARKTILLREKKSIEDAKKLHLMKAKQLYDRKKAARIKSKGSRVFAAFCMDYQKNLPLPNISTRDVYYRRQLSFHSFNIHLLANNTVWFYRYDETVARKGAEDVSSILDHFCTDILPEEVREAEIFCDSCSGQNKNYTVFRLLHHLVHGVKRFDSVKVVFPIRGHSYMECDSDMALINQNPELKCQMIGTEYLLRYRAAGLYPYNPEAVHYERLTVTNQWQYDDRAFAVSQETEHQIML